MKDQEIDSGGGWKWSAVPSQEEKKPQRARRADRHKYPKPMPEPVVYYGRGDSQYPETIRMSFAAPRPSAETHGEAEHGEAEHGEAEAGE